MPESKGEAEAHRGIESRDMVELLYKSYPEAPAGPVNHGATPFDFSPLRGLALRVTGEGTFSPLRGLALRVTGEGTLR